MNVVVVVVTYNRKHLLVECLNAILKQTKEVKKIIVVDNNSTDKTYEYLIENNLINNSTIHYKKLDKNIGGAGGFYEGIKECQKYSPDWVWIMDDDTIPTQSCLEELINSIKKIDGKISYLASSIYGEKGEFMNVPTINDDKNMNGYPNWYKYLKNGIVKIKIATFVSIMINNNAIKKVGFPYKDYFIWGDDVEYTLRLNKYYGDSYMIGNSVAIHKREVASSLSIVTEINNKRIDFYYYMIRNNLINYFVYFGKKKMLKYLINNQLISIKLLFNIKCKYRVKKFFIIHKGILSFIFGQYDKKAFKNRLSTDVIYIK